LRKNRDLHAKTSSDLTLYTLKDCDQIKAYQVFEFLGNEETHQVQQNDLVLVADPNNSEMCYFLGIVHTLKEKLMIVKTILNPEMLGSDEGEVQRFNNLVAYAQPDYSWSVQRLINLNNYNRCYLGVHNIVDTEPLVNHILDPSIAENTPVYESKTCNLLIQEGI
jgi:hypothetical protein